MEQKIAAGTKARRGDAVDLTLGPKVSLPNVKVPDVGNDKLETARRKIVERGLVVGQVSERTSCESLGKVLSQDPKGGTKVDSGSAVNITIGSAGEDAVPVPALVGHSREEVEATIQASGLRLGQFRRTETDSVPAGTVVGQKPAPGTLWARRCSVELTVAVAVPPVEVGNYVGMSVRQAEFLIAFSGLTSNVKRQVVDGPSGKVIAQDPSPSSLVRKGSAVSLIVSIPPQSGQGESVPSQEQTKYVPVPDVMGKITDIAQNMIKQAGLIPKVVPARGANCNSSACYVYAQDPAATKTVPLGTTVTLTVSPPIIK